MGKGLLSISGSDSQLSSYTIVTTTDAGLASEITDGYSLFV
jgi:hypothetical protein